MNRSFIAALCALLLCSAIIISYNARHGANAPSAQDDLAQAISSGDSLRVGALLSSGVQPNCTYGGVTTPLIIAVLDRHPDIVRLLIDHGADPNYRGGHGTTALHTAALQDDTAMVGLLLACGADPRLKNDLGFTPLEAARDGHCNAVVRFLESQRLADKNP